MTIQAAPVPPATELRAAVRQELAARGLFEADALAQALDCLAIKAAKIIGRLRYDASMELCLWVINQLDLPIRVTVSRNTCASCGGGR